ncbi:MAG: 1-acyl-sn-glycerol-3-phosphate acyltransferase [Deltaproteobacteria bacterium]|nr:MAG: 1-acyl-sn-glycerol-3-phosphate acyltransferase [Deltaproteobacteria bacterium]
MDDAKGKTLYPYVLDHKPGFFLSWFLYRLFKRVSIDENMKEDLRLMQKEGTVVYAIKYRGRLDYLLYHFNFRRRRIPYPKIAFDLNISMLLPFTQLLKIAFSQFSSLIRHGHLPSPYKSGFYKEAIQDRTPSLIFLVDPKGFARHFVHAEQDHIHFLLETQKEMDRPIFIVPQLVLYKKTPEKDYTSLMNLFFGYKDNPGVIRKTVLFFRHNRRAFIDFGRPLNLKAYLAGQPPTRPFHEMALEVKQMLVESIDRQKRVILGPIMKSRQQIKEIVLMDKGVQQKIEHIARGDPKRIRQERKKAGEYFDEIAADFNITYVLSFRMTLNWIWKRIFEGVDVDMNGLAKVREWARRGPVIYVPSHKSHIDYLILTQVLHDHHMHIPRIAAGKNLAFWPMGFIFRKCGAFFIRRSFAGARLYSEVFVRYIKALLEEGHPMEFFIEGGRSRNGKLVPPKTGFLTILLQALEEGFCEDLIFVPISIIYDRIIEEKSYLKEIGGGEKKQESLQQLITARRFLKRRYGKIYIRFNHPFSLQEYLSNRQKAGDESHLKLAYHLIRSINAVSLVTPLSLVATAILANHRRGFLMSELLDTVETLLSFLKRCDAPMADTLADPRKAMQETLSLLMGWKIVEMLEGAEKEEEIFYYVEEEKKLELEYYKNSIIHFFIPHSFVAVSLLTGPEEVKTLESIMADYGFLRDLFKGEFVFDGDEELKQKVISLTEYFLAARFLTPSERTVGYKITKLGFNKLPIWAALAKTFLESYWIAAKSVGQEKIEEAKRGDNLKNMDYLGKQFHKLGLVDHIGALSRLNYRNATSFIHEKIMKPSKDSTEDLSIALERLSQLGQRLYELSHYRS